MGFSLVLLVSIGHELGLKVLHVAQGAEGPFSPGWRIKGPVELLKKIHFFLNFHSFSDISIV
jgi:hypothetical protein